jgi:hypothetical protein
MKEIIDAVYATAIFLLKTLPVVIIVLYLVSYSIRKGYMEKLSDLTYPLLSKLNLSHIAAISVATCFLSPTASYSILSQAWREGEIDEREVIAISFLNSFPSVFSHLYAFFIPFVIPVLGFAGIMYTATRFGVAIIKSIFGYFLALKWRSGIKKEIRTEIKPISVSENIKRMAVIMTVTYFAVTLLSNLGAFEKLNDAVRFLPINPETISIAAVEFFNVRAAVILAAGFIDTGLSLKWAVIGLILGNVISFSTRSVKHSLPMHLSLFGKLGVKIVALNSIATLILDCFFIIAIYFLL